MDLLSRRRKTHRVALRGVSAVLSCALFCLSTAWAEERMDLSGTWKFQLDMMAFGKTPGSELYKKELNDTILLPGTTDLAGKGIANKARHVDRLTRKFEYMGQAWYRKNVVIPEQWKDREIILHLERCHWETTVYIDGRPAGTGERLSTPNRFILTDKLGPGEHEITICVDNRLKYPMDQWAHGTTEYTQTNWNGIVGRMELVAKDQLRLEKLKVTPDVEQGKIRVQADITPAGNKQGQQGEITFTVREKKGNAITSQRVPITLKEGPSSVSQDISLKGKFKPWDEFSPNLYELTAELNAGNIRNTAQTVFGMRNVAQGKHHIRLNGHNIHLRGVLDCAVFPLTGHPPMNTTPWKNIFSTVKSYGMNHVRFHSWCPPSAAFRAADELGLYLQVELPMWIKDVGKHPGRRDFFEKEMYAILDEYGNHPSFIMMCHGNENEGDFNVLEDLVVKARNYDSRRLYSASTARTHVKADQYYVSHVSSKGGITVYEGTPSTLWDKRRESDVDVPVIAHETGQRCMYPNFREMKKYTGVLEPRNMEVFRERLDAHGMLAQADDFFQATGAHTVLQYKEVNEALLRTPNSGGFQLLGLADFPGQGSAFVGILDAFWESKGLVTPEKYRESCAPTVLLCRLPKRVYSSGETLVPRFAVYHYGRVPLEKGELRWSLETQQGAIIGNGTVPMDEISCGTVREIGSADIPLAGTQQPSKLTLKVSLGKKLNNEWDIWVYPDKGNAGSGRKYILAKEWNEAARQALRDGKNVLLVPRNVQGRKTRFASHFWNPVMFRWDPMIVGTLIDRQSRAFSFFPTDIHADWQWWDILNYSRAMDLTALRQVTPVIQSIDTYERNRKLGIAFEANVEKGKLFVLCMDADKDMDKRPASRQLLRSIAHYIGSGEFAPRSRITLPELDMVFGASVEKPQTSANSDETAKQLLNR